VREAREVREADSTFAEAKGAKKNQRAREKGKTSPAKGIKDNRNGPPAGLALMTRSGPVLLLILRGTIYQYVPRLSRHRWLQIIIPFVDWPCYTHLSKCSPPPLRGPNHPLYSRSTCVHRKERTRHPIMIPAPASPPSCSVCRFGRSRTSRCWRKGGRHG